MMMPGFTAETSLHRTKNSYRASSAHGALPGAVGVVPQKGTACYECSNWSAGTQYRECRKSREVWILAKSLTARGGRNEHARI
jgi:hypothetical protein